MLGSRIKKLILIRLLFGSLFLYAPKVFQEVNPLVFYAASSAVALLTAFYILWYLTRRRLSWLVSTQILGDLLIEAYLVRFTGGVESLFAVFYVLSILSTALVLGRQNAILGTTALSCVTFFIASFLSYRQEIQGMGESIVRDPVYFFYAASVKVATFLIVGHLSRYLTGAVLELQNQLKLAERLSFLGEVVSNVAHEIRNPLATVRTAAEVLRDSLGGKLGSQDSKMLAIIDSESVRLTKTLERILSYARPVRPNPKMLQLDSVIEQTLNVVRLQRKNQGENEVAVEKKYDLKTTHVYADEEQLISALLNLTLNAYQAMPQGGIFRIRAGEDMRGTSIDLEDTGQGVPSEKMKDLFLPFKSSKKGGTGLGLAEVHKIITLHEGKIQVESQAGKGTVFHLYFPKP